MTIEQKFMDNLARAFDEPAEQQSAAALPQEGDDGLHEEELEKDEGDEQELEEDAGEEDEVEDEPEEEEEVKGRKYLTMVDAEGNPKRVHIDDLMRDTMHEAPGEDGESLISYEELRNGYQRQSDYTRKTQEIAREREEIAPYAAMVAHAKNDPDFVQHVQRYFQQGPNADLQQAAQLNVSDGEIAQLISSENEEHRQWASTILQAREQLRHTQQQRQQYEENARAEQQRMQKAYADAQKQRVLDAIPQYDSVKDDISAMLSGTYGYSGEEAANFVNNIMDAKAIRVVNDLLELRQAREKGDKLGLEGKRIAPRPPKAAKPGSATPASMRTARKGKKLTERAMRSGTSDDWANVIAHRLNL